MCGISGLFDARGRSEFPRPLLERMNQTLFHRGPDEEGLHLEPGIALAHRRLSIIDLSTGQQPLYNEDGSVAVVFNGEIYNFQDLVRELTACGHTFRTHSDTEVNRSRLGSSGGRPASRASAACSPSPCGIATARRLFLARDRLGVKPLYYAQLLETSNGFSAPS